MIDRDFVKYWQSLGKDFDATKDRVRNLIGSDHWLTEGTYKEIILRNAISRHLPENLKICTGFVCKEVGASNQIDLIIIDKSSFTLFKEGDLVIVTKSAVRAIIEVKTSLGSQQKIKKTLLKLSENANLIQQRSSEGPFWAGLFVFESPMDEQEKDKKEKLLLQALQKADKEASYPVDCVAYGHSTFVKYWPRRRDTNGPCWVSYELPDLAAGYFIGNIIAKLTAGLGYEDEAAIFPVEGTKETKKKFYIMRDETNVRSF
jgi:hypothetical protein